MRYADSAVRVEHVSMVLEPRPSLTRLPPEPLKDPLYACVAAVEEAPRGLRSAQFARDCDAVDDRSSSGTSQVKSQKSQLLELSSEHRMVMSELDGSLAILGMFIRGMVHVQSAAPKMELISEEATSQQQRRPRRLQRRGDDYDHDNAHDHDGNDHGNDNQPVRTTTSAAAAAVVSAATAASSNHQQGSQQEHQH